MRLIKGLTAAAIAASLLVLPAGALADGRDRDHDRMPDRWEKKHHLNVRANDARRDPDRDNLSNLSEFRHRTDPRKADTDGDHIDDDDELRLDTNPRREDTDDDGIDDDDEVSGTIVSFENGLLTIQLPADGAGTVSGRVTEATEVECEDDDDDDHTASASHDGGSGDNSGPGSDSSGPGPDGDDDRQDDDDDDRCTVANLTPGTRVHEAEFTRAMDGSIVFREVELVPAV